MVQAVKKGLKEREDALLTHYSIGQDLEKKRAAIGALQEQEQKTFGGDKAKTRKVGPCPDPPPSITILEVIAMVVMITRFQSED